MTPAVSKPQFLGETPVNINESPKYRDLTPAQWALEWIAMYGGIDELHHKTWLVAQIARILNGTQVLVKTARWSNGYEEDRFTLGEDSEQFKAWKVLYQGEVDEHGETEYEFSDGIPP